MLGVKILIVLILNTMHFSSYGMLAVLVVTGTYGISTESVIKAN